MVHRPTFVLGSFLVLLLWGCGGGSAPIGLMGAYRFEDGAVVSIRASAGDTLRYRFLEAGATGRLYPEGEGYVSGEGFAVREPVTVQARFETGPEGQGRALRWTGADGGSRLARRVGTDHWMEFESDGASLRGRLTVPEGPGPHPAVVLVHGSGEDAATRTYCNGDFFVAGGIAALVYDKRGTGRSGGDFTFDFQQLARDAAAAIDAVRARPEIDPRHVGLSGYSQGGWVAPLAASMRPDVAFVLVSYGLVASPAEEARVETREKVIARGVDPAKLEGLDDLTAASVKIVATGFREGWDEFAAIKARTRDAPWRDHLGGTPQASLLRYPRWLIKIIGPRRLPKGLPWYYDSSDLLHTLHVPTVWFVGEKDRSAPPELTVPYVQELIEDGRSHELVVVPGADHTMLLFEEEDGGRRPTKYAPGYFASEVSAARRLSGADRSGSLPAN